MTEVLSQVGARDLLDIALVSLIIYRLLILLKGTKAAKMLMGLVVLLVVSIISRAVPLYTLEWMLNGLWAYMVIAVVIVFQPEIRSALARMGEKTLMSPFRSAEELKVLEEVVKAAVAMASSRIGALIVLERNTQLEEFVELGTIVDAHVTRELLASIFHPGSPIHDGAVVIRAGRVVAAGCFLPIALEAELSRALGTRHRAALAVTEEQLALFGSNKKTIRDLAWRGVPRHAGSGKVFSDGDS
ncbi:hypothetical protein LCGC14_3024970 [marine sediment metagenome]|uniref:DAC domain-containing protein n=1 Tax=marine sediment metagenome TaxID=412755 RepID=A0A0F8ZKC2_9ZZZZ